jgi:NAD(P)-dependent dehydrogenase (short-subunit alcohol dehydrogenase family)
MNIMFQVTRSLSVDLQEFGIGVISVHPGWVRTDMGGPHATLSSHESVEGVLKVVADYDHRSQNGQFFDHKGNIFPW